MAIDIEPRQWHHHPDFRNTMVYLWDVGRNLDC